MAKQHSSKAERFLRHLEPIQGALAAFCRRSLYDGNEVADVLQSAVANAFRDFHLYAEGSNFRAWMFRYVSFEALNRNRAWKRTRAEPLTSDEIEESPTASALPDQDELVQQLLEDPESLLEGCEGAVSAAVRGLPDMQRQVFLLRSMGEFKYREIAESSNCRWAA